MSVSDQSPQVRPPWWAPSLTGCAVGAVMAGLSATPSLLPRSGLNQGLAAGLAFAAGYLVAVTVLGLVRLASGGRPRRRRAGAWPWLALGVVAVAAAVPVGAAWWSSQDDLRAVYGEPPVVVADAATAVVVGLATAAALVLVGKGIAAAFRALRRRFSRRAPRAAVALSAGSLVVVGLVLVAVGVAVTGAVVERSADAHNASMPPSPAEPSGQYRSVGPGSALSWQAAGFEGRSILAGGPSASEISAVTGRPALEPIRIYAGVDEPGGWTEHAAAVVSELDRLRAQDREVLVVAGTTGTGWLDPESIDAIEYLHDGSTALATMQYSKAESWHSFVFHPGAYREATKALVVAVHEWWSALPEASRPQLYLYGLSLGSRAVQDSFPDAQSLRAYGDGAVLAGTPYGTDMNAVLTSRRDPGSPVVVPVLDAGREFRWAAEGAAVDEAVGAWDRPRVLLLQHGTDPIVWAGLASVWQLPEWLEPGQRSPDVHPGMRWIPIVTGIHLMFDTSVDLVVPDGAGHRYGADTVDAWIAVTGDGGHPADILDAIRQTVTPQNGPPVGGGV